MARVAIAQAAQVRTGATPQERLVGNKAEAWKSSASKHVAQAQLSSRSRCDEQPPLRESALIGTTIAFALTLPFAAAHAHPASSEVGSVAQSQGFWENMAAYVRFSVSVALGFVITIWRPVGVFFKRWWSALLLFVLLGVSVWGTKVTLTAMLGLDDPSVVAS